MYPKKGLELFFILLFVAVVSMIVGWVVRTDQHESSRKRLEAIQMIREERRDLQFRTIKGWGLGEENAQRQEEIRRIVRRETRRSWKSFAQKQEIDEVEKVFRIVSAKYSE